MSDWSKTLPELHAKLWKVLTDAATSRPATRVVLATIGTNGAPQARMVVLRHADAEAGEVAIHTDILSTKITELREDPRATILLWSEDLHLQLRLRGAMRIATGAEVAHIWPKIPDGSRSSYGVTPAPGTPIAASDAYDRAPDQAKFAVLTLSIAEIDAVHLSGDYHRRAAFTRDDGWRGEWLAP